MTDPTSNLRAVLLSVKPRFAHPLLLGTKTAEVRRRFPFLASGTKVFVYSSSPDRAVIGTFTLTDVTRVDTEDVWGGHAHKLLIGRSELAEYLDGTTEAAIVGAAQPQVWEQPLLLSALRSEVGVEPPQSYRYVTAPQVAILEAHARPAPTNTRTLALV